MTDEQQEETITPDEAVRRLNMISGADQDGDHRAADEVLVAAVPAEVRDAYRALIDRSDGWWYE